MRHTPKLLGVIALMLALAGSATAAGVIITSSKQIKNGSIKLADLTEKARATITGPGVPGPAGVAGAKGDPGPAGPGSSAKGTSIAAGVSDVVLKPGDEFSTIAMLDLSSNQAGLLVLSGAVETAVEPNATATVVSLRIVHNGHAHPLPADTTVLPGTREALVASFQCNFQPGAQHLELQARSTGGSTTIAGRSFDAVSATQGQ